VTIVQNNVIFGLFLGKFEYDFKMKIFKEKYAKKNYEKIIHLKIENYF